MPLALPVVTLLFAGAFGLINLWLAVRASAVRIKRKAMVGDNGDPLMLARMRAHANFNEYVPLSLVLMALIEICGGLPTGLWICGALLVLGRLLHPFGMERPAPNAFRAGGIALTIVVLLALSLWAIWLVSRLPVGGGITYL